MDDGRFCDCVLDGFGVLRDQRPQARERVFAVLGSVSVGIQSDGEHMRLAAGDVGSCASEEARACDVVVRVGRQTLLDLGEGRVDFVDAIRREAVDVRGAPSDLAQTHGALVAFLEGAARAPAMAGVWERFRGGV